MHMSYRLPIFPALLCAAVCSAQISEGGLPPSFDAANAAVFSATAKVPTIQLAPLDAKKLLAEDSEQDVQGRFAAPLAQVDISLNTSGQWTGLANGDRVWRCAIESPNALGLLLLFDELRLPAGSRLFAYSEDKKSLFGAYTHKSCLSSGAFMIGVIKGQKAILELYEPAGLKGQSTLRIDRIDYVYDPAGMMPADVPDDFNDSYNCHINVNCTQGQGWQSEKRGVARILMIFSNGAGWCSGSLLANTSGSGDPLFLTAHHCQIIGLLPNFGLWRFDFDYEAPLCSNPVTEPTPKSVLGCERLSYRHETDFLLLRLNDIPGSYNLYFNGWDRTPGTNSSITNSTFIHHPVGDIKKISVDNDPATIFNQVINWGSGFGSTPAGSHWSVIPDEGFYEPGSSGSPLFDQNKRVVGQLHGGNLDTANCDVLVSWFGRFDQSWDQGDAPDSRLYDWLDPNSTNALTQDGYIQPAPTVIDIGGNIQTHWGEPMEDVLINLTGDATASTRTDASGDFIFEDLPAGLSYRVTPERDTNDINGITTFDLALINKHVLSLDTLDTPWKIIAADANGSNAVSTIDIVEGRKILLSLNTAFPNLGSWRFFPALTNFQNPLNPFVGFPGGLPPEFLQFSGIQDNVTDANFKGVKVGDVNNNAKPGG